MKKLLALMLALIMVLGLVACGAAEETTTETTETETTETTETEETTEEETTEEETTEEETVEEEWPLIQASALCFTSTGFTPKAESMGVDRYRENYGLDLEVLPVDISVDESWNIFWAGGGYADIILPYNRTQALQIIGEGIVRTIDPMWIKEYMPRMWEYLNIAYKGDEEKILKALAINGEYYYIPYGSTGGNISYNAAFRADWMENLGLELPTTVAEFGEILRAFTEDDPDGNGVDDTYGCTTFNYGLWNVPAAFGTAYHTSFWINDERTEITTNVNTDEYREMLTQFNEWYEAGWIDPEYITDDRAAARSKFANGTTGVYWDNPWWWETGRGEVGPLQMLAATQGLDYSTCCVFTTALVNEKTGRTAVLDYGSGGGGGGQACVYFGYETSDEVVIRMMKVIDEAVRLHTYDEEDKAAIYEMACRTNGIEGEHWEVDPETGRINVLVPLDAATQNELGMYLFPTAAVTDMSAFIGQEDEFCIELVAATRASDDVIHNYYNVGLPVLEGEIGDIYTTVTDYISECRTKFVSGEMDIETEWETYLENLESFGLYKVIEAYEENIIGG